MDETMLNPSSRGISNEAESTLQIAIVGMAGRFPGGDTLERFWENLREGVESIRHLTDEELRVLGVPRATRKKKNFVNAAALVDGIDQFDAAFFGYSPGEAEIMDPQHRIFLECAWEAMESAGYVPESYPGLIGVYAGTSLSSYLLYNLLSNLPDIHSENNFEVMIANDKDFLTTRVAYKLNLKGPAIDVQTGCSTSLVAIHLACQALLCYQCDMALAGGVSIQVPQRSGYYYIENGINSPDGHCRAFDAKAQGTIFGNGAGIVVLKRLTDALKNGDHIHAVVRGSAINNDGAQKVGYTAPSVEGQSSVIQAAQELGGVTPETISYIECHGTGTHLGDPIEVLALRNAFGNTRKKNFCALGTVKSNIGHLDAAAGVAGVIKSVLAMEHKVLPPSLHFETPNARLDLADSPFYVNRSQTQWKSGPVPLRAGVSSFGIGGTNAHIILEQAPPHLHSESIRPYQLLLLSAKTSGALELSIRRLLSHLQSHPEMDLADIAYTLTVGRKYFDHRCAFVANDIRDAARVLEEPDTSRLFRYQNDNSNRQVVFMFPGGGSQYVQMGLNLYETEAVFRSEVDFCADKLLPLLGFDIRSYLYPSQEDLKSATARMKETMVGLPALFATEYALAKLWMSWGILPTALIGHSLGEYTAATLAGVFSLDDALALVVARAKLFARLPAGAMVGVSLSPQEIEPFLGTGLSLAAVNGESQCLVSGAHSAVEAFMERLSELEIECRRLQIDVASHSHLVDPILPEFGAFLRTVAMHPPRMPYVSNVTGTWITDEDAMSPDYWVRHLRQPVLFGPGFLELASDPNLLFVEVGPSHTLSTLAKAASANRDSLLVVPSMRHPYDHQSDVAVLLAAAGKLWLAGDSLNWNKFYANERRSRVALPSYPFERRRYWLEPRAGQASNVTTDKLDDINQWFYLPSWKLLARPQDDCEMATDQDETSWLIFLDEGPIGSILAERLMEGGCDDVYLISQGSHFQLLDTNQFVLNPENPEDYLLLLDHFAKIGKQRLNVIHMWSVTNPHLDAARSFEDFQNLGMYSLVYFTQAFAAHDFTEPVSLWVISTGLHRVESKDEAIPDKVTLLSPCIIIPQEYENVSCWSIDIELSVGHAKKACDLLLAEIQAHTVNRVVAIRGEQRWVRSFEQVSLTDAKLDATLSHNGVYVITGGLGGIGLQIAGFLALLSGPKLALIERTALPAAQQWEAWLLGHPDDDPTCRKIRKLMELMARGAEVLVLAADVADEDQMMTAMNRVVSEWGNIDGIFHTAGIAGEMAMQLIPDIKKADCERHFYAKVEGTRTIARTLERVHPKFCQLFSSNAALLGGLGSVAYSASSLFMDAFAENIASRSATRWISVDWDPWLVRDDDRIHATYDTSLQKHALTPEESWEALRRVAASAVPGRIVVSTGNLALRLKEWTTETSGMQSKTKENANSSTLEVRPALATAYAPPGNELESIVINIWQETLRLDRLGIHDNFFDLGGNSLLGLRMITAVRKALQIELPIMALFEGPTVAALCRRIEQKESVMPSFQGSEVRGIRRRESAIRQGSAEQSIVACNALR